MHRLTQDNGSDRQPQIIGWRELVALPDWGIHAIQAKVDTGARTSAIHVDEIEELPNGRVRFDVIVKGGRQGEQRVHVPVEAEVVRLSRVRSSVSKQQERPVVRTRMRLGDVEREIELSLVCRHGLLCRMLLGRTAMKGKFLVDPSRSRVVSGSRKGGRAMR